MAGAVAALAALVLTGCSSISSGTVTGKEYSPAYTTTSLQCYSFGKAGCTMWMPVVHYWPATYQLDLRNGSKTGWVDVDARTYAQERVGDRYGE